MTARDDNPQLHRVEVERDAAGEVTDVRFVCDGDDTAPCHHWPDCGCEEWGDGHYLDDDWSKPYAERTIRPGHEDVPQQSCWMSPWFNDTTGGDPFEFADLFTGDPLGQGMSDLDEQLVSGPVTCAFEGDYMTWEYAP